MKTDKTDNELRSIIKGIQLDSPGNDFTLNVMARVYEEKTAIENVRDEKIFGKGFWIIVFLFVLLIVAMFVFSATGNEAGSLWSKILVSADGGLLSQKYNSLFSNLGSLPLSIGGILMASSILVLAERFLPQVMPHHTAQNSL